MVIVVEMNHDARIIRLTDKHAPAGRHPPLDGRQRRLVGGRHPGGRDHQLQSGRGLRPYFGQLDLLSPDAKVTERFTRVSPTQILYQFKVDDPATYSQTWQAEMPLNATKGPVYEYACHEGNYALPGILAGARQAEREGRKPEAVDVSE